MSKRSAPALVLAASLLGLAPAEAAVDASKPLLCSVSEAIECSALGDCVRVSPAGINLPQFIRVDVGKKLLTEHRGQRSTKVRSLERREGRLLLQGIEERPWSMSISQETGQMSVTSTDDGVGFVVFGACTEL